jgi:hypothetical protein
VTDAADGALETTGRAGKTQDLPARRAVLTADEKTVHVLEEPESREEGWRQPIISASAS